MFGSQGVLEHDIEYFSYTPHSPSVACRGARVAEVYAR